MKPVIANVDWANFSIKPVAHDRSVMVRNTVAQASNSNKETTLDDLRQTLKEKHGDYFDSPGYNLKVSRKRADLTQQQLAQALHIKQHHISEMENNKRSIGKKLAKRLADKLQCDYRKFL